MAAVVVRVMAVAIDHGEGRGQDRGQGRLEAPCQRRCGGGRLDRAYWQSDTQRQDWLPALGGPV